MGLIPLFCTILVRNFLRTVSAGKPYISTSTYVPTRLSVKNCPDKTVTETVPAIIPSTVDSANGSSRLKYLQNIFYIMEILHFIKLNDYFCQLTYLHVS